MKKGKIMKLQFRVRVAFLSPLSRLNIQIALIMKERERDRECYNIQTRCFEELFYKFFCNYSAINNISLIF